MSEHKQTEIVRNAIANTRRKELETYQRAQDMEWLNSRMDDCKRCIAQIDTETQMEKDYQERTDHAAQVNARAAKEIASMSITERQKQIEACEEMNEKLSRNIIAEQMERREREDIITNLQQQDLLEKYCQDDLHEREDAMTNMKETERALKGQIQDHVNRDKRDKADNRMYKQMTETTMMEGDDKERLKQKSIKERNMRYGEDLELQIQSNLLKKNKEKEMEDWRNENVFTFNNYMQRETDKESELTLNEHIPQVIESRGVPFINSRSLDNLGTDGPHSHPKCNAQCQVLRKFEN